MKSYNSIFEQTTHGPTLFFINHIDNVDEEMLKLIEFLRSMESVDYDSEIISEQIKVCLDDIGDLDDLTASYKRQMEREIARKVRNSLSNLKIAKDHVLHFKLSLDILIKFRSLKDHEQTGLYENLNKEPNFHLLETELDKKDNLIKDFLQWVVSLETKL